MKWIIPIVFLISVSCSNMSTKFFGKVNEMPAVKKKMDNVERTCVGDVKKGSLNIYFQTLLESQNFCACLLLGFGGLSNFEPLTNQYVDTTEELFDKSPANYVITFSENMREKYFDLTATIHNLNRHPSWKQRYDDLYRSKVNYCTRNANNGISI